MLQDAETPAYSHVLIYGTSYQFHTFTTNVTVIFDAFVYFMLLVSLSHLLNLKLTDHHLHGDCCPKDTSSYVVPIWSCWCLCI